MYMHFVGCMNEKQAAHWRSLRLKIHFGSFFNTWSSNHHNGDEGIIGTTRRLYMHVRFNFYFLLFRLFYAKQRGIIVQIESFMENANF